MDSSKFDPLLLNEKDFIVDPDDQSICFLALPIFTRITEMLSPKEFYNLALTCRYMHWRMFTYGRLMLKQRNVVVRDNGGELKIEEMTGTCRRKKIEKVVPRPYVYFKYLWLVFETTKDYKPSMFDDMIDYIQQAKKRTKYYCIAVMTSSYFCHIRQFILDLDKFIEKTNSLHLDICYVDDRPAVSMLELPNIKNIYSIALGGIDYPLLGETVYIHPCVAYEYASAEAICDIVQEFVRNSRLQFHVCLGWDDACVEMLEESWNLEFKEIREPGENIEGLDNPEFIRRYASISSEHGDVEIHIRGRSFVIQRKETKIGQWDNFYNDVFGYANHVLGYDDTVLDGYIAFERALVNLLYG